MGGRDWDTGGATTGGAVTGGVTDGLPVVTGTDTGGVVVGGLAGVAGAAQVEAARPRANAETKATKRDELFIANSNLLDHTDFYCDRW